MLPYSRADFASLRKGIIPVSVWRTARPVRQTRHYSVGLYAANTVLRSRRTIRSSFDLEAVRKVIAQDRDEVSIEVSKNSAH